MIEKLGYTPPERHKSVPEEQLSVQQKFLIVAKEHGVFDLLDERRKKLLDVYYNTPTPQTQLSEIAGGIHQPGIHKLIKTSLTFLRNALSQDVQKQFTPEELRKRKPLPTEARKKIGAASKGRRYIVTDERRANMSEGQKKYWRERNERERTKEMLVFEKPTLS